MSQASHGRANRFLRLTGLIWYLAAATGQGAFILFIILYYGTRTAIGDFAGWNDRPIILGHVEGDTGGNVMFILHVLLASIITLGGLMQLIPVLRRRVPALHRWNGRLFILIALFMAVGGLWLTWGRGTYLSLVSAVAVTGNGLLIILFVIPTLYHAIARRIDNHRRWAMRLFMVVNGVWFLRVAIMAWAIATQGAGMNETLSGPADSVIVFAAYLVPLGVLELYFVAQRRRSTTRKIVTGLLVLTATGIMALGIFGAVAFMWLPYL